MTSEDGRKIVIFGTGDFARIAAVYFDEDSPHEVVAFTVHRAYLDGEPLLGRQVVAFESSPRRFPPADYGMFVAIGFSGVNQAAGRASTSNARPRATS